MEQEKHYYQNINQSVDHGNNYYYISNNQSQNLISEPNAQSNIKNLEPQDNIKKSKRRHLLEMKNKLKNEKNNENYFQNFEAVQNNQDNNNIEKEYSDNFDIKSLTAIKANKTNKIFDRKFNEKDSMGQNVVNNLNVVKQNNILDNNENIQNKIDYLNLNTNYMNNNIINILQNNNMLHNINSNYLQNIIASPKILRKQHLCLENYPQNINSNQNLISNRKKTV